MIGRNTKGPEEFDRLVDNRMRTDLLMAGALPMANILALGLLGYRQRARPFLKGFVVFGSAALAFYVVSVSQVTDAGMRPYIEVVLDPLRKSLGSVPTIVLVAAVFFTLGTILVLPQVACGLIGGLIFRRFGTTQRQGLR